MARTGDWAYGSLIDKATGRVRWLAPTTIAKADPTDNKGGGCLKAFFYRYRLGFKGGEKTFQTLGNELHAQVENYLITGENTLGPITSAMKRFLPRPKTQRTWNSLLIEHDTGEGDIAKASLHIIGIPMIGYTDFIDLEGPFLDEQGELAGDPNNTIEVGDHKFGAAKRGADRDFSLEAHELPDDTQMVSYGIWVVNKTPTVSKPIRLSHLYTNTKGRPECSKSTILIPRERLLKRWEYIEGVARTIVDVAREVDPEKVPGNKHACDSFGGCAYRAQCSTHREATLESFFGGEATMGVIDSLNLDQLGGVPVAATPTSVVASLNLGADVAAQMAALNAPPAAPALPALPPEFGQCVDFINAKGYGFPPLSGDAAKMYSILMLQRGNKGFDINAQEYAGTGDLAKTGIVADPARLIGIAREIAPLPVKPVTAPAVPVAPPPPPAPPAVPATNPLAGLFSSETPPSDPAKAALPVDGFASMNAITPGVQIPGLVASVPASVAAPILAMGAPAAEPTNVAATMAPTEEKAKRKYTKRAKPDGAGGAAVAENHPAAMGDGRWLFINCLPNIAFEDCSRFVTEWTVGMAKHFKIGPYEDVRMAPKDHPLAFGAWRGALSAVARKAAGALAPGVYYLDTRSSELAEAIAEGFTMARMANADGTDGDPVFELIVKGPR